MSGGKVVPGERFELPTNGLQNRCSTTELTRQINDLAPSRYFLGTKNVNPSDHHQPNFGSFNLHRWDGSSHSTVSALEPHRVRWLCRGYAVRSGCWSQEAVGWMAGTKSIRTMRSSAPMSSSKCENAWGLWRRQSEYRPDHREPEGLREIAIAALDAKLIFGCRSSGWKTRAGRGAHTFS
jgi:hypothetical protein